MQGLRGFGTTAIVSSMYAAVIAGSALAQQVSAAEPAVDGVGLDEIVVTAQRRAETAQSVPMSISAFSAETLSHLNIVSTEDLAKITPGLQFGSASLQRNEIAIRGIGSNRFDAGGESSSAVFIDDVYQPQFSNLLVDLLDVDRVEVLKGPQGTLYGRNTIGGAIAVYTPAPSKELEVNARLDGGSKNLMGGMVSVSGPVSNSVSASISAGYRQRDGFMKDLVSGKDDGITSYGVRGKILYEPTDRLSLTLIGAAFASTQDAALLHRTTNFVFLLNPAVVTTAEPDRYQSSYTTPGAAATHTGMASAHLDYSGALFKFTSITSYQRSTSHDAEDDDSSQYDSFSYDDNLKAVSISQEFRIGSNDGDTRSTPGKLKWVAGLYYFRENASEPGIFHFGQDSVFVGLADFLGVPYPGAGILNTVDRQINIQSYAGFGQATYPLTDRLNLTLGARYTKDQKSVDSQGDTNLPGFPLIAAPFTAYHSENWGKFTPKATVDYKITDRALAYVTWARGYQSGAPQSVTFNPLLAQKFADPETVTTVEAGLKSELFDRRLRLNAAVFHSQFKNLQVRRVVDLGGGVAQPAVDNAADSTIKGLEFQTAWIASDNLRLDLGYAYTDARYGTYISNSTPGAIVDLSGNRLPRAPKSAVTAGARYELPLRNDASVAFGVLTTYTSTQFFQPENLPEEAQSGYATTDLTVTYGFPGKHWTATVWLNNVFDREYRTYAESLAPSGRDSWSDLRAGGITVRYRL